MVSIAFRVEGVEDSIIPGVIIMRGGGEHGYSVIVEYSERLGLDFREGDYLTLSFNKARYPSHEPNDYCGRAFLYSIKESGKSKVYLFSVGGFIIRIEGTRTLRGLEIAEEYYFCISKK